MSLTRFAKMADGSWGVNGPAGECIPGAEIAVTKRAGGESRVKILTATPARPGYVDCTIESLDRRPAKAAATPGKCSAPGCGREIDKKYTTCFRHSPKAQQARASGTCVNCGGSLDRWERSHGVARCSDCRDGGSRAHGGLSYRDRNGNFVLGDDD